MEAQILSNSTTSLIFINFVDITSGRITRIKQPVLKDI